ncbi:MAG: hypothetical protein IJA24_07090 [Alistipes sp.]|nr:hypothetical protein [Alistipes sp.]
MERVIRNILLMCACVCACACSKDGEDEPQDDFTYTRIVGKWETTSYYTSGGYFVPSMIDEYFEFTKGQTYTHSNDGTVRTGTYFFDPDNNRLHCEESKGWNLEINVSFESDNKATFDITGRTPNQSKIIKVERKTSQQ